jgi:hypothetical protein
MRLIEAAWNRDLELDKTGQALIGGLLCSMGADLNPGKSPTAEHRQLKAAFKALTVKFQPVLAWCAPRGPLATVRVLNWGLR